MSLGNNHCVEALSEMDGDCDLRMVFMHLCDILVFISSSDKVCVWSVCV